MIRRLAWNCHGSLGGCHPHAHAVLSGKSSGALGVLIFIVIIFAIGDHFNLWN